MLGQTDVLRARFNLAAGYANRALTPGADTREDLLRAAEYAEAARKEASMLRSEEGIAAELASNIHPVVTVLLAGVLLRLSRLDGDEDSQRRDRVDELHEEIVGFRSLGSDPGVAYALACYYTERGQHSDAIGALVSAIVAPSVREWARSDPWLVELRALPEWGSLFPSTDSPSFDVDAAVEALGLRAIPVAFELFELSGQVGWHLHGVVLIDGEPARVALAVPEPAAATPQVTIEVRLPSERLRGARVRVGKADVFLPLVQRGDRRVVFRGSLPAKASSWDDIRVWIVVDA